MRIIIVGCGKMGAGMAYDLVQRGHTVTVIDQNAETFELLKPSSKIRTVAGVGFDRDVLMEANIDRADALASVTSSDESNAVIARLASQIFRVPRVVARLCDLRKKAIYERIGIRTVDQMSWGIHRMSDLLCFSPLDDVYSLGDGGVDIVEVPVPALLVNRQVRELTVSGEIVVIAISRCGKTFLPTLGAQFEENDVVHLSVVPAAKDRLKIMLGLT
jgi:trk system potassium uptake protein TrkA